MRNLFEKSFVVFALLFFADAGLSLVQNPNRDINTYDPKSSDPVKATVALSVYLILLGFGLLKYKPIFSALRHNKLLVSLIALTTISVAWSPDPATSIKSVILLMATTLFGAYFAVRFSPPEQLKGLALTMIIGIGASFLVALLIPSYGNDREMVEAWRGIFSQKNELGRFAALSVVVFYFMSKQTRTRRWFWRSAIVLALGATVMSRSAAALVVLFAVGVSFAMFSLFRLTRRALIPAALFSCAFFTVVAALSSANMDSLLSVLGRDATLTGRTEIWRALAVPISKHQWFGYGYSGFWRGPGSDSESVAEDVKWNVQYAHNGFLDLALQLGWIGVFVFVCLLLNYFVRALRLLRWQVGTLCLWPPCFIVFIFVYNFSDSMIIANNNLFWVLLVIIGIQIRQTEAFSRQPARTPTLPHRPAVGQLFAASAAPSTPDFT